MNVPFSSSQKSRKQVGSRVRLLWTKNNRQHRLLPFTRNALKINLVPRRSTHALHILINKVSKINQFTNLLQLHNSWIFISHTRDYYMCRGTGYNFVYRGTRQYMYNNPLDYIITILKMLRTMSEVRTGVFLRQKSECNREMLLIILDYEHNKTNAQAITL